MKLIVGLGNPGKKYDGTRHNAGFYFIDKLATQLEITPVGADMKFSNEKKFKAEIAKTTKDGEEIFLVKPQTFMNLSGVTVQKIIRYNKLSYDDLIIVNDDIDLPLGYARVRHEGGSAGQKGLQNIIDTIGTDKFTRIRIGVGEYTGNIKEHDEPTGVRDTTDFVLSEFSDREVKILGKIIEEIVNYLLFYLDGKKGQIPARSFNVIES